MLNPFSLTEILLCTKICVLVIHNKRSTISIIDSEIISKVEVSESEGGTLKRQYNIREVKNTGIPSIAINNTLFLWYFSLQEYIRIVFTNLNPRYPSKILTNRYFKPPFFRLFTFPFFIEMFQVKQHKIMPFSSYCFSCFRIHHIF